MTLLDKFLNWLFVRRRVAKLESFFNRYEDNSVWSIIDRIEANARGLEKAINGLIDAHNSIVRERAAEARQRMEPIVIQADSIEFATTKPKRKYTSRKPTKEVLAELLWSIPTVEIAKKYGVSDKAVENWATSYKLRKPPRGYWQKLNMKNKGDK